MKHRRTHKHRISRKDYAPTKAIGEWSRMLHLWWKRDVQAKVSWKKDSHVA